MLRRNFFFPVLEREGMGFPLTHMLAIFLPMSNTKEWNRLVLRNSGDLVQAVFWARNLRGFSVSFDKILVLSSGKQPEVTKKIQRSSGPEYCFQLHCFPGFSYRKRWFFSHLFGQFSSFPEDRIINLGLCRSFLINHFASCSVKDLSGDKLADNP